MNHLVVVDASVVVKVVLEEEFTDRARALIQDSRRDRRLLFGPPRLQSEVINAIYQYLRRGQITLEEAEQIVRQSIQLPIQLYASPELYEEAFTFAHANHLTNTYDSQYVVLAKMLDAELWTADERLLNSVRADAPWVRWIGDYPTDG
jgi:predicted nucleic acid-binding protein